MQVIELKERRTKQDRFARAMRFYRNGVNETKELSAYEHA